VRKIGRITESRRVGKRAQNELIGVWGKVMDSEALIRAAFATLERWNERQWPCSTVDERK
jgi:hypothetical protein